MYEDTNLDQEYPSMYAMVNYMVEENERSGGYGYTFEQFIKLAGEFFNQRHHTDGLKTIFKLFDLDDSGFMPYE